MTKLVRTPEILGAMTGSFDDATMDGFVANPAAFAVAVGIDGERVDIQTVENSNDTFNITLPFYSKLEKRAGSMLSDSDLDAASGGIELSLTKEEATIYNMGMEAITYGDAETAAVGKKAVELVVNSNASLSAHQQAVEELAASRNK